MKSVKEYGNCFKKLHKKVDPNNRILVVNTFYQFLSELNPTIIPLIYTSISANLDETVNTTKSIEVGYKITQKNIQQ